MLKRLTGSKMLKMRIRVPRVLRGKLLLVVVKLRRRINVKISLLFVLNLVVMRTSKTLVCLKCPRRPRAMAPLRYLTSVTNS